MYDQVISDTLATTTSAVTHAITTNLPGLWTFQIAIGIVFMIVGAVVGIFAIRRRRGRRRAR